ncbi:MAG: hypothetical protein CL583_17140 [Alteromonadaceae bacterium]|nr:hypothetical protein [Alteromonadaceae bacterium]|tara:strand:+ start:1188 stop:1514 length:327 start_codon:yes stop_codon:yes gene_type:complete
MLKAKINKGLRQMLAESKAGPLVSVGVGDAMSARLASEADGIDLMLSSGFAISAEQLGLPDVEMYSRTENVLAVEKRGFEPLTSASGGQLLESFLNGEKWGKRYESAG